jgi:hypothetical protein
MAAVAELEAHRVLDTQEMLEVLEVGEFLITQVELGQ